MTISVDVVFRFLNFLIVCVGAVYLTKRYGILYIISAMREQKQKQEKIHDEYDDLLKQCELVNLHAQEQEFAYAAMKERFDLWRKEVQQEDMAKQEMLLRYGQNLQQKQTIKLQSLQRHQIIQRQMPILLQEISDSLQTKFQENSVLHKEYTNQLVKLIKEREL